MMLSQRLGQLDIYVGSHLSLILNRWLKIKSFCSPLISIMYDLSLLLTRIISLTLNKDGGVVDGIVFSKYNSELLFYYLVVHISFDSGIKSACLGRSDGGPKWANINLLLRVLISLSKFEYQSTTNTTNTS